MIDTLSNIWKELLGKEQIGPDQNFFDLGGTPVCAVKLFAEIHKVTGRVLSPLLIYQAPTIVSLAAILDGHSVPPFPRSLLLKSGTLEPPIFLLHGLGGSLMEFFSFVKHLNIPNAVYGLQSRGTDGLEDPSPTIQDMANYQLDAVQAVQPSGPYLLVGYSLGGLVALEIARSLVAAGHDAPLLVMIDSYPPLHTAPLAQQLGVFSRRVKLRLSRRSDPAYSKCHEPLDIDFTPAMARVRESSTKALHEYRPRPYSGTIRFIKPVMPSRFPSDPQQVWGQFLSRMRIDCVPGDHHTMLAVHFAQLAATVAGYLREFQTQKVAG